MSSAAQDWCARSLAQTLREAAPDAPAMSLEDLLDLHGQGSAAVLLMVLALFSTIPIAGVGTVLSLFILALAQRPDCWAPEKPKRVKPRKFKSKAEAQKAGRLF